uniref:PYD and CARD domain containing n=1 Tax=Myripristis murdjan TaxID=586833 RepID=A0A667WP58_9TELE
LALSFTRIQGYKEDLPEKKLKKFCMVLLDRRGEPRVKTSAVEGKDCITIAQVLVSTFTELGALQITLELLREIDCNEEAERLGELPARVSDITECSSPEKLSKNLHFVDKHRTALIQRVSTVPSLLDELLDSGVIKQEGYNTVMAQATSQAMMRELYKGPLNACGPSGKDIFYEILVELEPVLISDLRNN